MRQAIKNQYLIKLDPKYALENLLRTQITSKQGTSLIYKTSP